MVGDADAADVGLPLHDAPHHVFGFQQRAAGKGLDRDRRRLDTLHQARQKILRVYVNRKTHEACEKENNYFRHFYHLLSSFRPKPKYMFFRWERQHYLRKSRSKSAVFLTTLL